jgi:hypothetical protein
MKKILLMIITAVPSLFGCSHSQVENDLDQKIQSSTAVPGGESLGMKAEDAINASHELTSDQKSRLLALDGKTHDTVKSLDLQSYKLRDLLITDLGATRYNEDEVRAIKSRLHTISQQRLSAIFEAVDEANRILGHEAKNRAQILKAMGPSHRE